MIKYTKLIFLLFMISMNIGCDQITKNEVRKNIAPNEVIEIIDQNLILTKVENTGAAMSLGSKLPSVLKFLILKILPSIIMIGLIGFIIFNSKLSKFQQIAFAGIIGGGIGNLIDRFKFNSVTDFLFIEIGPFKTGIFNMADVSIFLGAILILFTSFKENKNMRMKASL